MPIHSRPVSGVDRRQLIAGAALAMAVTSVPRAFARATQEPATDVDTRLMRLAIEGELDAVTVPDLRARAQSRHQGAEPDGAR